MRLLSLTLGGMGLMATGANGAPQSIVPPEYLEALCRANEREYTGPPMPRILTPTTFSGTGCPSGGKIRHNYMGKWKCSHAYDVQLLIPDLNVAAGPGNIDKADCTITFYVDKLSPGWQVSLWDGVLDVDAEIGRGSELRMKGTAKWEGLQQAQGSPRSGFNPTNVPTVKYNKWAATINFGTGPTNPFSPCADANGEVGNLTVTYSLEADARFSTGPAVMKAGSWIDEGSGVPVQIDNAATLNLKWLIREC
ncbi:hypothetical protein QBC34DRAFT_447850 [Podospora aff. communis PSN243]|uniref:Secreted protein n=1 Tax=Podospora aff. communis PSN243 TaxID=3040156 RepID=A0AAV9GST1_9PEZI|nr:hypothetical protein QBC34DRAFT_447850 [Podospora aff. communis PSN243]